MALAKMAYFMTHKRWRLGIAAAAAPLVLDAAGGGGFGVGVVGVARAQVISMNFEDLMPPACSLDLGFWFFDRNIWGLGWTIGTDLCVVKYTGLGGVPNIRPSSGTRYLRQLAAEPGDYAFIFIFSRPVNSFTLTRPRLDGTAGTPVSFPAWTLVAQDSENNALDEVSQPAVTTMQTVAAQVFSVAAPGIAKVMISAHSLPGDTVYAMIIDDVSMTLQPCGSADFNGDGDSGTDADIEAFFTCVAGSCCAACGSADFDGDGDVGTDADIEAFFRVLAGGSC
jgi:hypothetical protein